MKITKPGSQNNGYKLKDLDYGKCFRIAANYPPHRDAYYMVVKRPYIASKFYTETVYAVNLKSGRIIPISPETTVTLASVTAEWSDV